MKFLDNGHMTKVFLGCSNMWDDIAFSLTAQLEYFTASGLTTWWDHN